MLYPDVCDFELHNEHDCPKAPENAPQLKSVLVKSRDVVFTSAKARGVPRMQTTWTMPLPRAS